jgi:hypothetical protein
MFFKEFSEIHKGIASIAEMLKGSRDSSVGIATSYGLDGRGLIADTINEHLSTESRPALRPTQSPIQWVRGILPRVKVAGE